ncbi:hypothetical protein [Streptomyces sp. NBRC 110611]|uniref:hypothetical protein n=1 Tax=Streptomyces sp. NBRC 110611 TaxID=1621259 RepID=UPI0011BEDCE3|nr:hypothetical protein [Streptomyces sp. NBRC 110611]
MGDTSGMGDTGDDAAVVRLLAVDIEAERISYAAALIKEARAILDGRKWTVGELQLLAVELTEALAEMHRIAKGRGQAVPGS